MLDPGIYRGQIHPGIQFELKPLRARSLEEDRRAVEAYAASIGYLAKQEGVGYHRPVLAASRELENAMDFAVGRPISEPELWGIYRGFEKQLGQELADRLPIIPTRRGFRVLNRGLQDNLEFHRIVQETAGASLPQNMQVRARTFQAVSDVVGNDWEVYPHGEDYLRRLSEAGRPDLQRGLDDLLAPQIQKVNTEYARRYGWDRPPGGGPGPGPGGPTSTGPASTLSVLASPSGGPRSGAASLSGRAFGIRALAGGRADRHSHPVAG